MRETADGLPSRHLLTRIKASVVPVIFVFSAVWVRQTAEKVCRKSGRLRNKPPKPPSAAQEAEKVAVLGVKRHKQPVVVEAGPSAKRFGYCRLPPVARAIKKKAAVVKAERPKVPPLPYPL